MRYWLNGNQREGESKREQQRGEEERKSRVVKWEDTETKWINRGGRFEGQHKERTSERRMRAMGDLCKEREEREIKSRSESWVVEETEPFSPQWKSVQQPHHISSRWSRFQSHTNSPSASPPDPPFASGIELGLSHYTVAMGTLTPPPRKWKLRRAGSSDQCVCVL